MVNRVNGGFVRTLVPGCTIPPAIDKLFVPVLPLRRSEKEVQR